MPGNLLNPTTTTVDGPWVGRTSEDETVQAFINGTGVVTATVLIEFSNFATFPSQPAPNNVVSPGILGGTIALANVNADSDGFVTQDAKWQYWRARVTAIGGTGATVYVLVGPK